MALAEGMKILCIKDHVRKHSRERIRAVIIKTVYYLGASGSHL